MTADTKFTQLINQGGKPETLTFGNRSSQLLAIAFKKKNSHLGSNGVSTPSIDKDIRSRQIRERKEGSAETRKTKHDNTSETGLRCQHVGPET